MGPRAIPGCKRGFTLVELMIAVALVVALGALAAPALKGFSDAAAFRQVCDQVANEVASGRIESMRRGIPLELQSVQDPRGGCTLILREGPGSEVAETAGTGASGDADQAVRWQRRGLTLADGFEVVDAKSLAGTDVETAMPVAPVGAEEQLIAAFLPDGTVAMEKVWVRNRTGRGADLLVNSWTGGVTWVERAAETEAGGEELVEPEVENASPDDAGASEDEPTDKER